MFIQAVEAFDELTNLYEVSPYLGGTLQLFHWTHISSLGINLGVSNDREWSNSIYLISQPSHELLFIGLYQLINYCVFIRFNWPSRLWCVFNIKIAKWKCCKPVLALAFCQYIFFLKLHITYTVHFIELAVISLRGLNE